MGDDMTPSSLNPIRDGNRRALYGTLPFVATYGMSRRETDVRRVLSSVSFKSMQDLSSMTEQQLELEEIDVDEVFSNIYIYEACTACVLIHVRISEMCDSEDAWLYKARTYLVLVYNM